MISIKNKDNIAGLKNGNQILGTFPEMDGSEIRFTGRNNILFCEEGVRLQESVLQFNKDNSVIYLGSNKYVYRLDVLIYQDSVFYMGRDAYVNHNMHVAVAEQRHCFIGDDCMFSLGIWIMNSDAHLVYSTETGKRLNPAKSVYIGDHVWVGQDCRLLKGTHIDSGSIIGAGSVVANKKIPHNESWGGNPVGKISDNIFWDGTCVLGWTQDKTYFSESYSAFLEKYETGHMTDDWIYTYTEGDAIEYSEIDGQLNKAQGSQERCDILLRLHEQKRKNRFVHSFDEKGMPC